MKLSISQTAKLAGVSVRTLHYYDEIGLLKPDFVDEQNGYRFYQDNALARLQEILFYKELEFRLSEIKDILTSENYNRKEALLRQKELFVIKKQRMENIMSILDNCLKGENTMGLNAFNNSEYESARNKYAEEARKLYGNTKAFKESEEKTVNYSKEKWNEVSEKGNAIMRQFAQCLKAGNSPQSEQAQSLCSIWQEYITQNYYSCTNEILAGLAKLYIQDERFKKNIDSFGDGTAEFMSNSITIYCKK